MELLGRYKNGNVITTIYSDGTKNDLHMMMNSIRLLLKIWILKSVIDAIEGAATAMRVVPQMGSSETS